MPRQRMYCIAMRHLSGIQKGIQSAHVIIEYSFLFAKKKHYSQWALVDKTLILLEANTSEQLKDLIFKLSHQGVNVANFCEPDLSNSITAIAFLLDERVWDYEKYPTAVNERVKNLRELISPFRLASN